MARAASIAIIIASLLQVLIFALSGHWLAAVCVILMGTFWVVDRLRGPGWATNTGLVLLTIAAAYGALIGVAPMLSLVSLIAVLVAWDIDRYCRRLDGGEVRAGTQMARMHVQRLAFVAGVSAILGGIALVARGGMGFWWLVPLALAVFLALGRLIVELRRSGAEEG